MSDVSKVRATGQVYSIEDTVARQRATEALALVTQKIQEINELVEELRSLTLPTVEGTTLVFGETNGDQ